MLCCVFDLRLRLFQVRVDSGTEMNVSATRVADRHLSIYWRMLRPEFVKGDADTTAYRVRHVRTVSTNAKVYPASTWHLLLWVHALPLGGGPTSVNARPVKSAFVLNRPQSDVSMAW